MATPPVKTVNANPGGADERGKGGGGRMLNRRPVWIGMAVSVMILALLGWIAAGRRQPAVVPNTSGSSTDTRASAMDSVNKVVGANEAGTIAATTPGAPGTPGSLAGGTALVDPSAAGTNGPTPVAGTNSNQMTPEQQAVASAAAMRQQQIESIRTTRVASYLDSLKAPSHVADVGQAGGQSGGPGAAGQQNGPLTDDQKRQALSQLMAQQQAAGIQPSGAEQAELARLQGDTGQPGSGAQSVRENYATFDGKPGENRWAATNVIDAPVSPFELRAGFVIPGVMISGVNSELPGQIVAQVAQNVMDNARGQFVLIPQGSRLIGTYANTVAYGQSRVLVAWQRVVFPDGKALDIGSMPGADSAGYAGFHDQVDNHYLRVFGSAILLSLIGAAAEVGQPQTSSFGGTTSVNQALSASLGQQLSQTATQLIEKNLSIAPTLKIRPGYRFNVVVTKDLVFPHQYKAFDY